MTSCHSEDMSTLDEWVAHGAKPYGTVHLRLHVEMERNALRLRAWALVLLVVTLLNAALTTLSIWLRFGAVPQ